MRYWVPMPSKRFIGIWGDTVTIFAGIPNVRQIPLSSPQCISRTRPTMRWQTWRRGFFDSTEQKLQLLESPQEYRRVR